jgi:flagellar biosynthesis protein FlhF
VATAEDSLSALDQQAGQMQNKSGANSMRRPAPNYPDANSKVEEDADQLAMSTLSFQDYVRERMMRKRSESVRAEPEGQTPAPAPIAAPIERTRPAAPAKMAIEVEPPVLKKVATPVRKAAPNVNPSPAMPQGIVDELHAMKEMIEDRFNTLTWLGQARQNPIQTNLMLKMIRSGYSPTLSRAILERMPEDMDATESFRWVMDVLERNLRTDNEGTSLHNEGGVFALMGATGVGKTTTAAKLAGLCARAHGSASVGLITLDTYRIGAHEQLRAYGKMLGVVAHLAHDKAALQDLLGLLSNKKMVLIDTTGIAPRDPRKRDMLELLDLPDIKRLLVLNAGNHGDTIDDAVNCFKTGGTQEAIFSKTDEAVKMGPAIDAAIRHQLVLRGITTGQRVPEDWEAAHANKLVRMSMRSAGSSAYDPKASDLGFFFNPNNASSTGFKGHLDA